MGGGLGTLILLAAATADELLQAAFPTRTFDLRDLAMNIVGILAFGMAAAAAPRRKCSSAEVSAILMTQTAR